MTDKRPAVEIEQDRLESLQAPSPSGHRIPADGRKLLTFPSETREGELLRTVVPLRNRAECHECHDPHGSASGPLLATGSVHAPFEDACATCHLGSYSELIEGGGSALCFACPTDLEREVQNAGVPHSALEMSECIDCHSPHASRQPRLLRHPLLKHLLVVMML